MSRVIALELLEEIGKDIRSDSDCFVGFELSIDPIQNWPRMKRLTVTISLPNPEGENIYSVVLPESEGQSSEAITSTETSGRQVCGMDLGNGTKCSGPKDHPAGLHQYEVDFL